VKFFGRERREDICWTKIELDALSSLLRASGGKLRMGRASFRGRNVAMAATDVSRFTTVGSRGAEVKQRAFGAESQRSDGRCKDCCGSRHFHDQSWRSV
jgi:hypothetical protein